MNMSVINEMLNEGYNLKRISIKNEIIECDFIRYVDFFKDYLTIEFMNDEIMFVSYNSLDWIIIKADEDEG